MKKLVLSLFVTSLAFANTATNSFPTNAESGQCFVQVSTPAKYETVNDNVLVKEASQTSKSFGWYSRLCSGGAV